MDNAEENKKPKCLICRATLIERSKLDSGPFMVRLICPIEKCPVDIITISRAKWEQAGFDADLIPDFNDVWGGAGPDMVLALA